MTRYPRWIFQALEGYDLKTKLHVGKKECWKKVPHWDNPSRIGEDQQIIFFQATKREFHGLGVIISVSSCKLRDERHTKEVGVDVLYTDKFSPPISAPKALPKWARDKKMWANKQIPDLLTGHFTGVLHGISGRDWANLGRIFPRLA